jgi:hypothetical protein
VSHAGRDHSVTAFVLFAVVLFAFVLFAFVLFFDVVVLMGISSMLW